MKAKIYIPALLLTLVLLSGCTQNNGHIGKLFGAWLMTEMSVDGTPKEFDPGAYTSVAFQSGIVRFDYHADELIYIERVGTWQRIDDNMRLDFTHGDDTYAPGTGTYQAPEWLDMPAKTTIDVTITQLSSGRMTWVYTDPRGKVITYKFERTW
ncbi:MAG: hypothetical protein K1W01_02600 [Muribaculaceae bacterium]